MTDVPPGSGKFTRIPRTSGSPGVDVRVRLRDSVEAIEAFLHHAVASNATHSVATPPPTPLARWL